MRNQPGVGRGTTTVWNRSQNVEGEQEQAKAEGDDFHRSSIIPCGGRP